MTGGCLSGGVKLNVMALVDSAGFDAEALAKGVELSDYDLRPGDLTELKRLFEHATTFGSLIQVPEGLASSLPALKQLSEATSQDLFVSEALKRLAPLVQQAELLGAQYDAVVANPPYMGSKYQPMPLRKFIKDQFPNSKPDIYAAFMTRSAMLARAAGLSVLITRDTWMFQPSFLAIRNEVLAASRIMNLADLGTRAFDSISGEVVRTAAFILAKQPLDGFTPVFLRLNKGTSEEKRERLLSGDFRFERTRQNAFQQIPGSPLAYWVGENVRDLFHNAPNISEFGESLAGLQTDDNNRFLRFWFEVSTLKTGFGCESRNKAESVGKKWYPLVKGGGFRRWFGNLEYVVNWEFDGAEIRESTKDAPGGRVVNSDYYFKAGITWSLTSTLFSAREMDAGIIFNIQSPALFGAPSKDFLAFLNSKPSQFLLDLGNPGLSFVPNSVAALPFIRDSVGNSDTGLSTTYQVCVQYGRQDWNAYERSWDFQSLPLLTASTEPTPTLESSYSAWITENKGTIAEMKRLEEENNRLFIDAYGLADELTPDVPIEQITLTVNPAYRYGGKLTDEEQWTRFRQDTMEELVSYAIGCMMGRYSLDAPGLIYAHSGNEGFDPSRYTSFSADDDGIVPLTDNEWFVDDATQRLMAFVAVAFPDGAGAKNLEANLNFLADNLSPKKSEFSRETIRRYLSDSYFKKHLQTYKNRPIYWLFSSGKTKAFQCLVYLHRYNEGTLSRMRTDYVIPLTAKLASHVATLEQEKDASSATTDIKRLEKEITRLHKQQAELSTFDEKLRHYADQRIALDLDDGVKVNYGKFGDLLADVKAVTGKAPATKA